MIDFKGCIEKLEGDEDRETVRSAAYQKRLFEACVEKGKNFPKERKLLKKKFLSGEALSGKKGLRKQLAAIDLEYFGRAYFPHYFTRPSPWFHGELDKIWLDGVLKGQSPYEKPEEINGFQGCRRAIEAPRGHAKSTTFTFKDTLHASLYGYKHYIIILSDSSEQAEGFLRDIKAELEDNRAVKEDFGEPQGPVWKSNVILLSNGVKIEGIGSGKKIRGRRHKQWRPDLIVLDDIENDENVNTPEQRRKLYHWFTKAVSKAGDTYTDIVYIGTLLHFDSLLAKVAKNPEYKTVKYQGIIRFAENRPLWDAWEALFTDLENSRREEDAEAFFEANREEMLKGTEVLWEEKQSYYRLMVMKVSEGEAAFSSEIQNEPIDPESCTFREEWLDFYDGDKPDFSLPRFVFIGACDPSLGKDRNADTSSILIGAKDLLTGYIYVVTASVERRAPDAIITDVIELSRRLRLDYGKGFYRFGVEDVQFQFFFKDVMAKRALAAGEYIPIEPIHSTQNKFIRIQSLQSFVKNGFIKFSEKHKTLLQQMKEYPMGKNDDAPDGLEMMVRLALGVSAGTGGDYRTVAGRQVKFKSGAY